MASAAKAPETLPPMARLMRETKFARGEEFVAAEKSAHEKGAVGDRSSHALAD